MQGVDRNVGVRDAAQHLLNVFKREWFWTMSCAAIKLHHHHVIRLRLEVHACECQVAAWAQLLRVGKVNLSRVAGKLRLRTCELETACLAHNTTASIATHEPPTFKRSVTGRNSHPICGLLKVSNAKPALDPYTQVFRAASQHRFKLLHFRQQTGVGRTW